MTDPNNNDNSASPSDIQNSEQQASGPSDDAVRDAVKATGYAGDVTASQAYAALAGKAVIVDVRTVAEWNFVGLPALSPEHLAVCEWQRYPDMQPNPDFTATVTQEVLARSQANDPAEAPDVYFLCRSGARSRSAAIAMTQAGFPRCFNIRNGFEGDPDSDGHRGTVNGWKVDGLPWRQG